MRINKIQIKDWIYKINDNIHKIENEMKNGNINLKEMQEDVINQYKLIALLKNIKNGKTVLKGISFKK
jgi:hypothetical protein